MESGKFYLFSAPFFWTYVGRYVRHVGLDIEIADAIYFTKTGATFDVLRSKGLQEGSKYHGPFRQYFIPAHPTGKTPWGAKTPWVK